MNDTTTTRWWWVRHAVVPNPEAVIYGDADRDCDTGDVAAFKGLAANLPPGALWVTSNLRRAAQTAQAIRLAGLDGPPPLVEPDLREQGLGAWQGRTWEDIQATENARYSAFWRISAYGRPPKGESFADLCARACPVIRRLTDTHGGRDIIAVTHGGTIRAAVALALGLDPQRGLVVQVDNLSITRLDWIAEDGGGVWRVVGVNLPPGRC